jgi:hypothetical protein
MSEDTGAPEVDASPATEIALGADAPESFDSPERAVASLVAAREKSQSPAAESAEEATAEPELSEEDNAAPETDPSEQPEAVEPQNPEPIDPPRSWTQAEKERFATLPRETQEYIHAREQERERDFRRGQNEIAEQRKAVQAEREAAEKARQQYEARLPALMQELESAQQNTFADIKTMDDVVKLQAEDPFRFQAWQVQQMRLQAAKAENDRVTAEKTAAEQSNWMKHVQEENAKAAEFIPELADKDKGLKLTQRVATELLPELGFKDSELAALANGKEKLSIYDHRVQRLLADALKLRDIQSAPKPIAAKPLPPVQRPGVARAPGADKAAALQTLTEKLSNSGSENDALELLIAKRATRRA